MPNQKEWGASPSAPAVPAKPKENITEAQEAFRTLVNELSAQGIKVPDSQKVLVNWMAKN
jgi:hypothetical protein